MDLSGIFGDTSGFLAQLQDAHNEVVGSLNIPSWDEVMGDDAPSMLADLWKFVDAVDWRNEPFFKYLAGFYAVLVTVFLWSLTTVDRTVGMTVVLVVLGLSTTFLNTLGVLLPQPSSTVWRGAIVALRGHWPRALGRVSAHGRQESTR